MQQRMNAPRTQRRIGYLLIADALVGLSLAVVGLLGLWWAESRIRAGVEEFAALADRAVNTTSGLLVGIDTAVATAHDSMGTIDQTLSHVADTLDSTSRLTQSASDIAGKDIVGIVRDTQESLASMERTARLVDDTLGVIARIPLIGGRYEPEVPLHESVARVATSLGRLPTSLLSVQGDLADTSKNLSNMKADVLALSVSLGAIEDSLATLETATADYRDIAAGLQEDLSHFRQVFPRALRFATLFGTAVMLWLAIAQLGLLTQGLERITPSDEARGA
jgi:hypothetical protein